jgi:putative ABC transport system permease protein
VKLESGVLQDEERYFGYTGRLRPGATQEAARLEARVVARQLESARPGDRAGAAANVTGVWFVNPSSGPAFSLLLAMLAIPSLVLLIACLNAANLLLARATHRLRELAVRLALGATRWRLVRQQLIESLLLALVAVAASAPIVLWTLVWARTMIDLPMPIDWRVVTFAVGLAVISAVAFSMMPALRVSMVRPGAALGSSRAGDAGPGKTRTRRVLVVAQVALSIGLLATGSQMITFLPAQMQSAGTPPGRLLMASFDVSLLRMSAPEGRAFYERLLDRVSTLPEAEGAGLARKTGSGCSARACAAAPWRSCSRRSSPVKARSRSAGTPVVSCSARQVFGSSKVGRSRARMTDWFRRSRSSIARSLTSSLAARPSVALCASRSGPRLPTACHQSKSPSWG